MRINRMIAVLTVLVISHLSVAPSSNAESQILKAQKAKLILVGEVLYVAKPTRALTNPGIDHQVVVFHVGEVLKGTHPATNTRISFGFSFDERSSLLEYRNTNAYQLSSTAFAKGAKWILIIEGESEQVPEQTGGRFIDSCGEPKPTAEFQRYATAPCYVADIDTAIAATDDEIEAVRSLVKKK